MLLPLAACGVPDDALLTELTSDEFRRLCDEYPERQVACDGDNVTFSYGGECDTADVSDVPATCRATAADWRACFDSIGEASDAELCDPEWTGRCTVVFSADCFGG